MVHLYIKFIRYVWKCRAFGSGVVIFNVMAVLWKASAVSMLQGNSTSHGSKEKQRALARQNTFTQVTPNHFWDWYHLIYSFLLMCISELHPCGYFHISMKQIVNHFYYSTMDRHFVVGDKRNVIWDGCPNIIQRVNTVTHGISHRMSQTSCIKERNYVMMIK